MEELMYFMPLDQAPRDIPEGMGVVYVARLSNGNCKIGATNDPRSRRSDLRHFFSCYAGVEVTEFYVTKPRPDYGLLEDKLHLFFNDRLLHGEVFRVGLEAVDCCVGGIDAGEDRLEVIPNRLRKPDPESAKHVSWVGGEYPLGYKRVCGYMVAKDGKVRPKAFYLGYDGPTAVRLAEVIESQWKAQKADGRRTWDEGKLNELHLAIKRAKSRSPIKSPGDLRPGALAV